MGSLWHLDGEREKWVRGPQHANLWFHPCLLVSFSETESLSFIRSGLLHLSLGVFCILRWVNVSGHLSKHGRSKDGDDTGYWTVSYVLKNSVQLSVLDELGNDDVAGVQQGAVLDKKTAAADGGAHAVEKKTLRRTTLHSAPARWKSYSCWGQRRRPSWTTTASEPLYGSLPSRFRSH